MSTFAIRRYHPSDLVMLYRICLETGADGDDATGTIDDQILGHFFAAPYAVLEPGLCFVLTHEGAPCGYIVGTADSSEFQRRMDTEWLPPLRERYPLPDAEDRAREAGMIRAIHHGYQPPAFANEFPAHLHIDLLPVGQGKGQGALMIEQFLEALRAQGCAGMHLGVSPRNERALRFYPKLGFTEIESTASSIYFGLDLT